MSYAGTVSQGMFDPVVVRGVLHIDIFQVSTGERVAELSGFFFLEDPFESLDNATWISDRHFLVPTSNKRLGAMLCDMQPTVPRETAWDFVDATNEILGFWEEPQLVGYFNALNSLHLHAAVRLADAGQYSIKADVSGPGARPLFGFPHLLDAGIQSIDADLSYPQSDGKWDVRAMTLMGGRPSAVVATAVHLGPTEEYISLATHRPPEPRPLPVTKLNRVAPPFSGRHLPDNIQATGLDPDSSGKFAALSVSIPLTDWPLANCLWRATLVDRNNAGVDVVYVSVPVKQRQVTFIFDGAKISGNAGGPPWRLAGVQTQCQVRTGTWDVSFDDNPLHGITRWSRDDFTTVPPSSQARLTGRNIFELIDDDRDGYAGFLHVQFGVSTSRSNCTLSASVNDPEDVVIAGLDMPQDADGPRFRHTFKDLYLNTESRECIASKSMA
jgi:hypothetical protein